MLQCARDAVQLPDELFELFRTAKVQSAVPQKADRQHNENRQADGECGEHDGDEKRVERCEGLGHSASKCGSPTVRITVAQQR